MKKKIKRALVTGGLGFIGSHLCDMLLNEDVEIIVVDNKSTNAVDEDYFKGTKSRSFISSIEEFDLEKYASDVDIVYHLASILGPVGVLKHGGNIGIKTLTDTIKLRNFCLDRHIRLVDISTSEIYGHIGILKEESEKVFPGKYQVRSEYGAAKMLAEMALINYEITEPGIDFQIIRPFNVAGPRQKPDGGFVLPRFVIAALTNQPITVYGDGKQRRAFTHVLDICKAILTIGNAEIRNETWNVGNPQNEMTIDNMANLVMRISVEKNKSLKPQKIYIDPKTLHGNYFAEAIDKIPFIEKVSTKTGWSPVYSAEKVIEDVIDYYQSKISDGYMFKVC